MAISTLSKRFNFETLKGTVNLTSDELRILLMRHGFNFQYNLHSYLKNIKTTYTGNSNLSFTSSNNTITTTDSSVNFIDIGFTYGNKLTISSTSSNNITTTITGVYAQSIRVADNLVDENGTSAVLTTDDELPAGNGYTQNSKTLGAVTVVEESFKYDYPNIVWTASGGNIGPTPGAIIYDNTHPDKVIVGYIDFGSDYSASDGESFTIAGIEIYS